MLDYLFISRYLCCFMSAALHLRLHCASIAPSFILWYGFLSGSRKDTHLNALAVIQSAQYSVHNMTFTVSERHALLLPNQGKSTAY